MESNHSLFSLTIDPVTKVHLTETAKWARVLAIIGFISLVLMVFIVIGAISLMGSMDIENSYGAGSMFPGFGVAMAIYYVIIAAIWFIPLLYLYRFANRMRAAFVSNSAFCSSPL